MGKKTTSEPQSLALRDDNAALADLEAYFDGAGEDVTGLERVDESDFRLPTYLWNRRGVDAHGRSYPPDVYVNTLTGEVRESLDDIVLLAIAMGKKWAYFDAGTDQMVTVCSSTDRKYGILRIDQRGIGKEGLRRPCPGCPQSKWVTNDQGNKTLLCSNTVIAVCMDKRTGDAFVIRVKGRSARDFATYLQQHHINKMPRGAKFRHVPLCFYAMKFGLKLGTDGKVAFLTMERGERNTPEELGELREASLGAREYLDRLLASSSAEDDSQGDEQHGESGRQQPQQAQFTDADFA